MSSKPLQRWDYQDWPEALITTQESVVTAGNDFTAIMNAVTNGALEVLPHADGAILCMVEGQNLKVCAASGKTTYAIGERYPIDATLSGRAVLSRHICICDDTLLHSFARKYPTYHHIIRSVLSVPIIYEGEVVGVLTVLALRKHAFTERDKLAVQLLVGPIVIGLSNLRVADAQQAKMLADRRFEATFLHAPIGIAHVSLDGRFLLVNDRFCQITQYSREALLACGYSEITHPDDVTTNLSRLGELLKDGTHRYAMERRYIRPNGSIAWVNLTVSLVCNMAGEPDFFVSVIEDISEIRRIRAQALHDPLTALLNRRGMMDRLKREIALSAKGESWLSLLYLDLDDFKKVNDGHGHAAGDQGLVGIADAIRQTMGQGHAAGRVGGDEFVVVAPGMDGTMLLSMIDILRERIALVGAGKDWSVSASIGGISLITGPDNSAEQLIEMADNMMFAAKRAGKGQARIRSLAA